MRVEWTVPALLDMVEIKTFIEKDSPEAAQAVAQRVWDTSQRLGDQPSMGRIGDVEGTREMVVQKTSCILVYRHQDDQVEILHVHYDRRDWQVH